MTRHSIDFQREHAMGLPAALDAARRIGDELVADYACQCRWEGDVLHFSRSGVSGTLVVGEREVGLRVKLGFLLAGFKPRIEAVLSRNFDRYFETTNVGDDSARS